MKEYRIKNYTSGVSPAKSIAAIEELLILAGAKQISKFYNDSMEIDGIIFQMPLKPGVMPIFKLPSKVKNVARIMNARTEAQKRQAECTAWKLLHDWVSIQVSMIKLEQIESVEAFLPYVYDTQEKRTLFESAKDGKIKLLN